MLTVLMSVRVIMVPHATPGMENANVYLDIMEIHVKRLVRNGNLEPGVKRHVSATNPILLTAVTSMVSVTARVVGRDPTAQTLIRLTPMIHTVPARMEEVATQLQEIAVVLMDIMALTVRKGVRMGNLEWDARRTACARTEVCVILWMGSVNVLVVGMVSAATYVMSTDCFYFLNSCLFVCCFRQGTSRLMCFVDLHLGYTAIGIFLQELAACLRYPMNTSVK